MIAANISTKISVYQVSGIIQNAFYMPIHLMLSTNTDILETYKITGPPSGALEEP